MFSIKDKVVVITGGYGVLGASMARCLAGQGAHVVIVGRKAEKGEALAAELSALGTEALFCKADVLDRKAVTAAREEIVAKWGKIDVLINAAGGNMPGATIMPDKSFMDIDFSAFGDVVNLNLMGTVIPTVIFGEQMAKQKHGSIINISSMTAQRVVTRVVGYSASKSAIVSGIRSPTASARTMTNWPGRAACATRGASTFIRQMVAVSISFFTSLNLS